MKTTLKSLFMIAGSFLLISSVRAEVAVGFSWGDSVRWGRSGHEWGGHRFRDHDDWDRHRFHDHDRVVVNPFWPVVAAQPVIYEPVVVQQPVITQPVVTQPVIVPSPAPVQAPSSPDYSQQLGDFHARLANDRKLLSRQLAKGGITGVQYDHETAALDQIAESERRKAEAGNGYLSVDQVDELVRQLAETEAKIQQDLIQ